MPLYVSFHVMWQEGHRHATAGEHTTLEELRLRVLAYLKGQADGTIKSAISASLSSMSSSSTVAARGDGGDCGGNTSNGETFSDTGYQATWETSRLQDGVEGILTNFTGGNRGAAAGLGTPAERATEFLTEFEAVFPGVTAAHNGTLARFHWPTNDFVRASYSCYAPGQYSTICGAEIEAEASGHLHFCGEHTSLDAQGYMEGAALTGAAAAVAVAVNLGVVGDEQALLADSPASRILARADVVRRERRHRRRR